MFKGFEDQHIAKELISKIREISRKIDKEIKIMEVCGTHTQVISKYGLRKVLPNNIKLISGPGCPVCVTPSLFIEKAIALAQKGFTIMSFGDLLKVPSQNGSLEKKKSEGYKVEVVYSPLDALEYAQNKREEVIFLGIGFETTIPAICVTLERAISEKIKNFKILSAHKTIPEPLKILASDPNLKIDGFILPGHVSVIIGSKIYDFLGQDYKKASVISGFTLIDVLSSILILLKKIVEKDFKCYNNYKRAVSESGNVIAQNLLKTYFEKEDSEWRGFGLIKDSGLKLKSEFAEFDASLIEVKVSEVEEPKGCRCGDVLKGIISPKDCPLLGKVCTPDNPVGACMVSSEGSCSAYYKYERD